MKKTILSLPKVLTILLIMCSTAHAEKVCETIGECYDLADQIAKQVQEIKPGCRLVSEFDYRNNKLRNVDGLVLPSVGHTPWSLSTRFANFYITDSEGSKLAKGRLKTEWEVYRNILPGDREVAGKILWEEYFSYDKRNRANYDDNSENLNCN
jgi:hypothetical protein